MGLAPLFLRAAPFCGLPVFGTTWFPLIGNLDFPFPTLRLTPRYPAQSPLADVLRLVPPGSDEYVTEKYAFEIDLVLKEWSRALKRHVRDDSASGKVP